MKDPGWALVDDIHHFLRLRVVALREETRRRIFEPRIEVWARADLISVRDDATRRGLSVDDVTDHALRVEVLLALTDHAVTDHAVTSPALTAPSASADAPTEVLVTFVRSGTGDAQDVDAAWGRAATFACAAGEASLVGCYVITRWGWRNVHTGQSRVWRRPRAS